MLSEINFASGVLHLHAVLYIRLYYVPFTPDIDINALKHRNDDT
jgi:hypothetical protein